MNLANLKPYFAFGLLALLLLWETAAPFLDFPKGRARLVHGARNLSLGVANGLLAALVFAGLWWFAAETSAKYSIGLLHWFKVPAPIRFIGAFLLFDMWMYAWHRLNHRVPFLWRFHRVHHSDPHMDVTTANRFHFGEIIMSSLLRVPVIALIGLRIEELAVYEVLMFAVVQFHHANIGLSPRIDRWLNAVIVTPFMHKVHHSRWQPETDSNYASFLSIWDRLFRSFRRSNDPHGIKIGLNEWDAPQHQNLPGMMLTPFNDTESTK